MVEFSMSCAECLQYRKKIQKLESNISKSIKPADAFIHCGCRFPKLHKNNSGPAGHKLCYNCAGWRRA